jgi:hypothetical protein
MFLKELGPPQEPLTGILNWVSIAEYVNTESSSIPPMVIHIRKAP